MNSELDQIRDQMWAIRRHLSERVTIVDESFKTFTLFVQLIGCFGPDVTLQEALKKARHWQEKSYQDKKAEAIDGVYRKTISYQNKAATLRKLFDQTKTLGEIEGEARKIFMKDLEDRMDVHALQAAVKG